MKRELSFSVVLVFGVVTGACGGPTDQPNSEIVTRDSAGVLIVSNVRSALEPGAALERSPAPLISLGEAAGDDPATQFSFVQSTRRLSDGRILVLDGQANELRWFDAQGQHLMSVGGSGQGPGEFTSATKMIVLPGDTVLVEDRPLIKHVFFGPGGRFIREETLDHAALLSVGRLGECAGGTLPDRSLLICQHLPSDPVPRPDPGPGHLRDSLQYVRVSFDLKQRSLLGLYSGLEQWGVSYAGRTEFALHPFFSRTFTDAGGSPMRIVVARNPDYSIEVWTRDGRLDRIIRRVGARRAPTSEEVKDAEASFLRFARGDRALENRFKSEIDVPDSIPAVTDLVVGRGGDIWVGRTPRLPSTTESTYDVFDPSGSYLGAIQFPSVFDVHEVGIDYVLGVRFDQLQVPYVELYGLRRVP